MNNQDLAQILAITLPQQEGKGPWIARQEAPHIHYAVYRENPNIIGMMVKVEFNNQFHTHHVYYRPGQEVQAIATLSEWTQEKLAQLAKRR